MAWLWPMRPPQVYMSLHRRQNLRQLHCRLRLVPMPPCIPGPRTLLRQMVQHQQRHGLRSPHLLCRQRLLR